ncbi:YqaE/Pmp3 family membrane protein [Paenibacillus illinoisensis]|uniref:YqaE/Pmp3 family membrane protein n=1 Tax=Paenibacillus illinoisensis TaxID=59845 RepID=UPI00203EF569|nr:YqaE/Pmp3 family membrane protein [Paenibacillus illinoisensis]MCM3208479.1 YqaE/Pmp3 family membrane protein [Paenibacillus illinoisensis]
MRYLLCFIPPVAVLLCGKPFQAVIALLLMLAGYAPGVIYAFFVVNNYKADQRNKKLIKEIRKANQNNSPA